MAEYPERWKAHRAKRRPDLEVCLECGREVAADGLPDTWHVVTDSSSQVVGFLCERHPEVAAEWSP